VSLFSAHGAAHLVGQYGAWVVGVVVGLESMGLPLPAESMLLAVSAVDGTSHQGGIVWIVLAAAVGAIAGDNIGYMIGRTIGWRALRRWGRHIGLTQDRLTLGAYLFRRHGGKVVFFGRFVVLLRTASALLAGANRMDWPRFLVANAAGGIIWASVYGFGAYALGKAVERIATPAAIGMGAVAVGVLVFVFLKVRRHEQELIEAAKREMGDMGKDGGAGNQGQAASARISV
jgi:membrane protein DedA with SNARE-associated domain